MPASPPYIPNGDADFENWLANFSTLLTAAPATYGLIAADAAAVAAQQAAWSAAYTAAIGGTTRGPFTIATKDTARVTALATVRPYAQLIANNAGVSVDDKIAIGVNPRTNPPSPITVPATYPLISVVSATMLNHVLRFRDQLASPSVKSKPYGVMSVQLFGMTSVTPVTDPTTLPLIIAATKTPLQVNWDSAAANKLAYYAGRWATRTGLVGPWSPIVAFTVPGGST